MQHLRTSFILYCFFFAKGLLAVTLEDVAGAISDFAKENVAACVAGGAAIISTYEWYSTRQDVGKLTDALSKEKKRYYDLCESAKYTQFNNMSAQDRLFMKNLADMALEKVSPALKEAADGCTRYVAKVASVQNLMESMIQRHTARMDINETFSIRHYWRKAEDDAHQTRHDIEKILQYQKFTTDGIRQIKKEVESTRNCLNNTLIPSSEVMLAALLDFKAQFTLPPRPQGRKRPTEN